MTNLPKIPFLKLLNLEAVTPKNVSSTIFRNHLLVEPHHDADLAYKNNSIKTGYENFCIEKGTLKLFPFKDFDFIGKHVVCQKCYQKFASTLSYKAHAGTDICIRTYHKPNPIYLKYKNKNYRQASKKKIKSKKNFDVSAIKKNVSNPEIVNTLQTRNKVYSNTKIQNKVKGKAMNNSDKNNYDLSVKKPRGRPKKDIISNDVKVNLKKLGRPKKLNVVTVNNLNQNDNTSNNNLEMDESEKPKKVNNHSLHYTFNENINKDEKLQLLSSKMKYLLAEFWKLFTKEFTLKFVDINKYKYTPQHKTQYNEEKKGDLSAEENQIFLKIEELEHDFKFIFEQLRGKKEFPFNDELKLTMIKICEIKKSLLKKTDMKESIPKKGKENIKHTLIKNENETEIEMDNIDFDKNEKCIGIWINNNNIDSPTTSMKINDGCKSIDRTNKDNSKKEPTSQDSFEDNLKTLTVDKTPNITNSNNHLNDLGLNYILNHTLNCRICKKNFTSIAEWKLHRSEHMAKINKEFLCTVCGLKFKMYKNFKKHVNIHKKSEKKKSNDKKSVKNLVCKVCNRQYDYLRSYYAHIKTHVKE